MNTDICYNLAYYTVMAIIGIVILRYFLNMENFSEKNHHKHHSHHSHHTHHNKHHMHHNNKLSQAEQENKLLALEEKVESSTCRSMTTPFDLDGGGNAVFLDRHHIGCWNHENLSSFRLGRNSEGNKYQYLYKCCGNTDMVSKPSNWQCLPNILTPLRKNSKGNVECAATDGKNCLWQNDLASCQNLVNSMPQNLQPLACGDMHKQIYGGTGYDTPGHWCSAGYSELVDLGN